MIIYGASGHGKVVLSALQNKVTRFFDDGGQLDTFKGLTVTPYSSSIDENEEVIIAIGDNGIRSKVAQKVDHKFGQAIADSAIIDTSVSIGEGSQILHGTIIQSDASVGKHTIVNTGASIDHDCEIGDFCHIAPQVTLCGNVTVGSGTIIGAGSTVIPGITIGVNCKIGAGSVVTKNILDNSIAVGNPARVIKTV